MSNPIVISILVLSEAAVAGIPGSFDRLRKVFCTICVDEMTHELVRETIGGDRYRKLVA